MKIFKKLNSIQDFDFYAKCVLVGLCLGIPIGVGIFFYAQYMVFGILP